MNVNQYHSASDETQMPSWVRPAVITVGLLLLIFIVWRAFAGLSSNSAADNRKPLQVRPGMYNLQAEFAKSGARRQQGQVSPAVRYAGTR